MEGIKNFFKEVGREFKKVKWPSGKDMKKYSVVTIEFVIFFALFFYAITALMAFLETLV
mgnify:CR=1 FL=1